jgi:hypothetical protein
MRDAIETLVGRLDSRLLGNKLPTSGARLRRVVHRHCGDAPAGEPLGGPPAGRLSAPARRVWCGEPGESFPPPDAEPDLDEADLAAVEAERDEVPF